MADAPPKSGRSRSPAENAGPFTVSAQDEAEARPLAGKADAYDAALTALREDTPHW